MPHQKDLPFLLALLDDDATEVRSKVVAELTAFGEELPELVKPFLPQLSPAQREVLDSILQQVAQHQLAHTWMAWLGQGDFHQALETALIQLSTLEFGTQAMFLANWLDSLAEQFRTWTPQPNSYTLMQFLFEEKGFVCPPESQQTFHHGFLYHLAQHQQGSQTTLTCLALLLGERVGVDLHGIFIRGHFIPMAYQETHVKMYNARDRGKPLSRSSALYMEEALRRNCTWPSEMRAPVFEIVNRLLGQVIGSFEQQRAWPKAQRYQQHQCELHQELANKGIFLD